MSIRHGSVHGVHGPIERAQAHGMRNVLKCEVWLAPPNHQPGAEPPTLRKVWIDRQSPIHESRSVIELMGYKGESICTHTQCYGVVATHIYCLPGQPRSFGTLLHMIGHPATRLAQHIAPRCHAVGTGQARVHLDRLAKELERLAVRILGPPTSFRQPSQVIVVRIQIFGWFAPGPPDLLPLQFWGDCTNDAGSHMVLKIEHILERTLKTVRPEMCSGFGIDKLTGDTNPVSGLAHAAFQHVAHPELAADLLHIDGAAFVGETRIARDYKQPVKA